MSRLNKGVLFAVMAYILWGLLPIYWNLLSAINTPHILAFRILCSLLVVNCVLLLQKNTRWIRCFRDPRKCPLLVLAGIIISCNWGIYIWAVNAGHTIESSLGYYINPLVSVVLGLLIFKEKLRPLQWAAFGLAMLGVMILTVLAGAPPWISLGLAVSFGLYGALKKAIALPALETLGAETLVGALPALALLLLRFDAAPGEAAIDWRGLSYLAELPVRVWLPLLLSGAVTALPMYCFTRGARILPLSALGFIQLISPTLQFLEGLLAFGESFPIKNFAGAVCIWGAAILYILSNLRLGKKNAYN